jgi:hypothetical protein
MALSFSTFMAAAAAAGSPGKKAAFHAAGLLEEDQGRARRGGSLGLQAAGQAASPHAARRRRGAQFREAG